MRQEYQIMVIAWLAVIAWIAVVIGMNRKRHPKALFFLFMVELWERFSYYGMRAFLVLYLTSMTLNGGFGFDKSKAYGIYGAYGALVYLTPLLGGFIADKFFGFRKAIIWGACLMAAGQFCLSVSQDKPLFLYVGLSLLVLGNGFFKPNISSLVGKYYQQGDARRDGAFTIFYMGINMGAFLAPMTCGTVAEVEGWGYGFLLAGIGMCTGLAIFLYSAAKGYLEEKADPPVSKLTLPWGLPSGSIYLLSLLLIPVLSGLIMQNDIMDYLLGTIGLTAIGYMLWLSTKYPPVEGQRIWVIVVLLIFTAIFWTFFELAGSALNIFTANHINKNIGFGLTLTTSNFQALNALFIMIFAPVFSYMWIKLAEKKLEPAAPIKFSIALFLLGIGFLVLNLGKGAAVDAVIPAIFMILLYLFHTLGELALSPVGLSLVTKLAPSQIVGFMMGFWFLAPSIAHQAGKWISNLTVVDEKAPPEETMAQALSVFNTVGFIAIGSSILLLVLSPILKRWMHGVK